MLRPAGKRPARLRSYFRAGAGQLDLPIGSEHRKILKTQQRHP